MLKTYFIQSGGLGGPIKIGSSHKPRKRVRQLQCGNPEQLVLLAYVDGDYEKLFHELLSEHRVSGEWFSHSIVAKIVNLYNLEHLNEAIPLYSILMQFSRCSLVKMTRRPALQRHDFTLENAFSLFKDIFGEGGTDG